MKSARLCVIGSPIEHSRSPYLHHAFGKQSNIELQYEKHEIKPDQLSAFLQRAHTDQLLGMNLTLPLKSDVIPLCTELDISAQRAQAANTLLRTEQGWKGFNTDGSGLVRDLQQRHHLILQAKRVLIVGAGGAVRGILPALLDAGIASISIANRTLKKAQDLCAAVHAENGVANAIELSQLTQQKAFDLIINASSAGHFDNAELDWPACLIHSSSCVYDLSYGKAAIPTLRWCSDHDITGHDGLGMLIEQAADAFAIWFGTRPDTTAVWGELRAQL
jgi:shikimate dehydrogenase